MLIHTPIVFTIPFSIILQCMLRFLKWSPFFSSPFPHMRATFPESIILSDLRCSRNIWLKYLELPHHAITKRQRRQRSWFSSSIYLTTYERNLQALNRHVLYIGLSGIAVFQSLELLSSAFLLPWYLVSQGRLCGPVPPNCVFQLAEVELLHTPPLHCGIFGLSRT